MKIKNTLVRLTVKAPLAECPDHIGSVYLDMEFDGTVPQNDNFGVNGFQFRLTESRIQYDYLPTLDYGEEEEDVLNSATIEYEYLLDDERGVFPMISVKDLIEDGYIDLDPINRYLKDRKGSQNTRFNIMNNDQKKFVKFMHGYWKQYVDRKGVNHIMNKRK